MGIETVLILDTETTGLHPDKGSQMIEVGAILYSAKHKCVLQSFASLFPCVENPVEHVNNIKPEVTQEPMPHKLVLPHLIEMANNAQACVAHNAEFDIKFLDATWPQIPQKWKERKWICTKKDFKWPVPLYRNRLEDICNAMGVPYIDAHRALIDCHFIALCFSKVADLVLRLDQAGRNSFSMSTNFR